MSEITYAAHTSSCTFLLDADGICRRIIPVESSRRGPPSSSKRDTRSAARCVGAQYVASLDPSVSGMLADMPRIGAAMLFARIDERGRVSLVRTGVVTHFERHEEEHPFVDSDRGESDELPSHSVETSAPVLEPSRSSQTDELDDDDDVDPYEDEVERTRPIDTLDPAALRRLRRPAFDSAPSEPGDEQEEEDEEMLLRTAEYEAARQPIESEDIVSTPATLRQTPRLPNSEPYTARTGRLAPPRRSEPQMIDRSEETTNGRGMFRGQPTPGARVDSDARTLTRTPRPSSPPPPTERLAVRGRRER